MTPSEFFLEQAELYESWARGESARQPRDAVTQAKLCRELAAQLATTSKKLNDCHHPAIELNGYWGASKGARDAWLCVLCGAEFVLHDPYRNLLDIETRDSRIKQLERIVRSGVDRIQTAAWEPADDAWLEEVEAVLSDKCQSTAEPKEAGFRDYYRPACCAVCGIPERTYTSLDRTKTATSIADEHSKEMALISQSSSGDGDVAMTLRQWDREILLREIKRLSP